MAFGGAYPWSYVPAIAALGCLAFLTRPRVAADGFRALDIALLVCLAAAALQLLPVPLVLRDAVSPHAVTLDYALTLDAGVVDRRPLSLNAAATRKGALVAAMIVLFFWVARETFTRGGLRQVVRSVAWTAMAISVVAIVCRALGPSLVYAIWYPGVDTTPFGPFVNRNHMATWLVMALPLPAGYLAARFERYAGTPGRAFDATAVWLVGAAGAVVAALIVSLSRSGIVAAAAAGLCGGAIASGRRGARAAWWIVGVGALAVAIALAIPRTRELILRFENSRTTATWARAQIWRETLPIVRDFPAVGVGVGAYPTAMIVYQQSDRKFFFNQAHNQYLQIAAEGGLLMIVPLLTAAIAFQLAVVRQLRADRSPVFWLRVAAVAGIVGALTQSIWETGLRFPANGLLFAVLCAIAVHDRSE